MIHTPPRAQPPLAHIPANFNAAVRWGLQRFIPAWVRWKTPIAEIQVHQADTLAELYQAFQSGKTRFLIAFRHPSPEDAYCLAHLIWQVVPQSAKRQGRPLNSPIHAHFIYDRGIPLWAGNWVGWLYSKLGGTSIQRGKLDLVALRAARQLFSEGHFPMVAAPEGGNNGHNEIISPLEPGVAQLGFWCVDDIQKADRSESVVIVPLGIQYRFVNQPWKAVEALLSELEASSGLEPIGPSSAQPDSQKGPPLVGQQAEKRAEKRAENFADIGLSPEAAIDLYRRLYRLAEHMLTLMEGYYQKFYNTAFSKVAATDPQVAATDPNSELAQRLQILLDSALQVAETYFGLKPKGSVIDRCRRLEQAGWDRIFREDLKEDADLSPVERGLADRLAAEADLRMWHMRLVESFVAVTGRYVLEKPTVDRFAETVLLMRDMITRIQGKNAFPRPQLGQQRAIVTVGEPIVVSERWADYKKSRKRAVETLTQDLQKALEDLIIQD